MSLSASFPRLRPLAGSGEHGWIATILGLLLVLLLWELLTRSVLSGSYILAGPVAIFERIIADRELFTRAAIVTLREAAWGFFWGNLVAVFLAATVIVLPRMERLINTLTLVVFCLPIVAIGPILRVLYGPGEGPQITLAAMVYYTTFVPLVVGLRAVPAGWIDLISSYGRGRWTLLVTVRMRGAIPYLVAGMQIAAPAAFLGAMVGEFTGAERGMGVLSIQTMRSLDVAGTWALATIATLISITGYMLVGWIGRYLTPDRPPLLLAGSAAPTHRGWRATLGTIVNVVLSAVVIVVLWQGLMDLFSLPRFFAKRPGDVMTYLITGPDAADHRDQLFTALGGTLAVTVPGYLAGLAMGVGLAIIFCLLPVVAQVTTPVAIALRSIPIVATAPLIVLALGRGMTGMLVIVAVMIFFPTLVAAAQGLKQAPGQILDVFDSFSAGRVRTLIEARIPAMIPALFAAARMSVPMAVLAATVAEWLATGTGIGNLMALTSSTSNYNMLWSSVVVLTLVSVAGYALVGVLERWALYYFAPEQMSR